MSAEPFIDTTIWVYAHTDEPSDRRGPRPKALVEDGRRVVISTRVLSEYYAAMLNNGAGDSLIQQNIESVVPRCDLRLIDLSAIPKVYEQLLWRGLNRSVNQPVTAY